MLDHPWARLLLGVLAAAALGALAARVALSVPSGSGTTEPAGAAGTSSRSGAGASVGTGGASAAAGSSSGDRTSAGATEGGVSATLGGGSGSVTVHVTGAVRRPGVYELPEGARVFEAVRKAGGADRGADRQRLNLAAPVRDGQQVLVPERAPAATSAVPGDGASGTGEAPIDLNSATLEQLQTLDGVGPTTAEKILKLREERGGLGGVDDLDEVPGIGPKKLEALRGQLGG